MSDLYRAGYEYGYSGDVRLIEQLPMELTRAQRLEFDRGVIAGNRAARIAACCFVAALLFATGLIFWWMMK